MANIGWCNGRHRRCSVRYRRSPAHVLAADRGSRGSRTRSSAAGIGLWVSDQHNLAQFVAHRAGVVRRRYRGRGEPDSYCRQAHGEYVRATYPDARAWVLNHGDVSADLEGIEFDDADPEVVILGGAGPEFTHEALSRVLELLLAGVPVVAMHRGMMWETVDGLRIDTGTYLPGFEEVAGVNIAAVGKPSLTGFLTATELMHVEPEATVMVGDDLIGDVLSSQRVGLTGVLVRTGKFRQTVLDLSVQKPDHVIDSVADLPALLGVVLEA